MMRSARCTECQDQVTDVRVGLREAELTAIDAGCPNCGSGKLEYVDGVAWFVPDPEPTLKSVSKGWNFVLLVLLAGCAEPVDIDPEPFVFVADDVVIEEPETPVLEPVAATFPSPLLARAYSGPVQRELVVSDDFPPLMQESILAAIDAWREVTDGSVDLTAVIGPTECDQRGAIHAAPNGECHIKCEPRGDDSVFDANGACIKGCGCYIGWFTTRFGITMRNDRTDPEEVYWVAFHELGHALGLPHSHGFMNGYAPEDTWLDDKHWRRLSEARNWARSMLPEGRVDAPWTEEN